MATSDSSVARQTTQHSPEEPARRFVRLCREGQHPELRQFLAESGDLSDAAVADVLRIDLCERWRAGERKLVEDYLRDYLPATSDPAVLVDLIYQEYLLREESGETPSCDEYQRRFPQSADQLRQQIEFHRALVSNDGAANDREAESQPTASHDAAHTAALPGIWIGPYELLQKLGEGGMGQVWVAQQQEPVRRRVAVKIIKAGMDSDQIVARFEQERQTLAMMDHPHIAKVLDAGTTKAGRPYVVMELVDGVPINRYCDQGQLTTRERLELFVPVCRAVQHAHQKGIIHRDLKPTNVLIAQYDGRPAPKIIDFGVAKAISQRLTDRTMYTEVGTIVGTIEYMAPEQAELNNLDIDTRADVYGLGAMLYELLTGGPPFSSQVLRSAAFTDMMRVIHDVDPPKPSTRVSSSVDLPAIAAARKLEPKRLPKLLSGELDCIVLKCLEKDRARRYETANSLAADILRFLANEPIEAQPPTLRYRAGKFVRRNKAAVLAAGLVLLALIGGVIGTTGGLVRAKTQLTRAENAERQARLREAEALVGEAHGTRHSRREGQRFATLAALKKAADIGRELEQPPQWFDRLRNEAIAALALPDLHITRQWDGLPEGSNYAAVSGDFQVYARSDTRGAVRVRRVENDLEIAQLAEGPEAALPFLSQDGAHVGHVFRQGKQRFARIWQIGAGETKELAQVKEVSWIAFMDRREGRLAVCVHLNGEISVYGVATGERQAHFDAVELTNGCIIDPHPTEPLIAICSYHHRAVLIRNILTGAVVRREIPPWPGGSTCAWHPSGRYLCVCRSDADADADDLRVYQLDPPSGGLVFRRTIACGHGETQLTFNPEGDRFVATGWTSNLSIWNFWTGRQIFRTRSNSLSKRTTFKADGSELGLAYALEGVGQIGVWSVADAREYQPVIASTKSPAVPVTPFELHPGGKIAVQYFTDGLRVFDLATGVELAHLSSKGTKADGRCGGVAFDAGGNMLINGFSGLFRWPVAQDATNSSKWLIGPPTRLPFHAGDQRPGTSRDGNVIAQSMYNGYGMEAHAGGWILSPDSPNPRRVDPGSSYASASVSPDGRWVAFALASNSGGFAKVFAADTGKPVWQSPNSAGRCRFSANGRWLLTGRDPGVAYAVETWEPGPDLGPGGLCDCMADDSLAVLDLGTGVYRLVEMASGREIARLEDPDQYTGFARFTADGAKLVAQAQDGLRVWDLRRIRQELTKLGLDWDAAPFPRPETEPASEELRRGPLEVEIVGAESRHCELFDRPPPAVNGEKQPGR